MKLAELAQSSLESEARQRGLQFRAGRFSVRLHTTLPSVIQGIRTTYADCEHLDEPFADFTVSLMPSKGWRRWYRPQAVFSLNGAHPFSPLPLEHAYPLFEWGLNWCVSNHCHQYLIVHAAVVEKHGRALILPGMPGAGKSTLTAVLTGRGGWRLLSDELTLIDLTSGLLHPNPRPISLKNASIDIARRELAGCVLSPPVHDTLKGTVAHLRPLAGSIEATDQAAAPGAIVFPRYQHGTPCALVPLSRGEAFIRMADNAFNYSILGVTAFRALARLVDQSHCFEYPNGGGLDQALAMMDELIAS